MMAQENTLKDLFLAYTRTGIVQFGRFMNGGQPSPIGFHFLLLPSFPLLMQQTAEHLAPYFVMQSERDRLLTTRNTIALGGVLATLTQMPMLFPHGEARDYTTAFAIEGAADVGNPITLLTDVLSDGKTEAQLATQARRVGLAVNRVVTIVELQGPAHKRLQEEHHISQIEGLFSVDVVLDWLLEAGMITPQLATAIHNWQLSH